MRHRGAGADLAISTTLSRQPSEMTPSVASCRQASFNPSISESQALPSRWTTISAGSVGRFLRSLRSRSPTYCATWFFRRRSFCRDGLVENRMMRPPPAINVKADVLFFTSMPMTTSALSVVSRTNGHLPFVRRILLRNDVADIATQAPLFGLLGDVPDPAASPLRRVGASHHVGMNHRRHHLEFLRQFLDRPRRQFVRRPRASFRTVNHQEAETRLHVGSLERSPYGARLSREIAESREIVVCDDFRIVVSSARIKTTSSEP